MAALRAAGLEAIAGGIDARLDGDRCRADVFRDAGALRPLWMTGAGLLALSIGKLFLIDLGALSGLPRVIAFLGVGTLLLLIGYLSPLPPAADAQRRTDGLTTGHARQPRQGARPLAGARNT